MNDERKLPEDEMFMGEHTAQADDEEFDTSIEEEFTYAEEPARTADIPVAPEKKRPFDSRTNSRKNASFRHEKQSEDDEYTVPVTAGREDSYAFALQHRALEQARHAARGKLDAALKQGTLYHTTVAGTTEYQGEAYWCCYEGPFTILIPIFDSFMKLPSNLLKKAEHDFNLLKQQRTFLDKATGSQIKVVITNKEISAEGNEIYFGSRTSAMAVERRHYFGSNANKKLTVGSNVMAQVLTTGPSSAHLTFCGIDVKVYVSSLTHRYVPNVAECYQPGDRIPVKIMYLKESEGMLPVVGVSGRDLELVEKQGNLYRVTKNLRTFATVTSIKIDNSGKSTVSLYLDNLDLPAFSTVISIAQQVSLGTGDKVQFECRGITEKGYVHGAITRLIRKR